MTANMPIGHGWPEQKQRLMSATLALLQNHAGRGEADMKAGKKWTDRTSQARQGLTGRASVSVGASSSRSFGTLGVVGGMGSQFGTNVKRMSLVLSHTAEHGKWLETIHGAAMGRRRFMSPADLNAPENAGPLAIVVPTAKKIAPVLRSGVKRIWNRATS